jgi:hypothetical protein
MDDVKDQHRLPSRARKPSAKVVEPFETEEERGINFDR